MLKTNAKDFFKKHWLILAPMAGVNDIAFRELCIDCGATLTYTEMISSKGLDYYNPKTLELLRLSDNENKVVVQLFGHEPQIIAKQAKNVSENLGDKLAYVDINMGCPAKKIVKKGDGAALMNNVDTASAIVKACSEYVNTSVKFRNSENVFEFAEAMQNAGAFAMCVHPRYQNQYYKGLADWSVIEKIKKNSSVPIIGSGDIQSYKQSNDKLQFCDAVMIGRSARGNPYVFDNKKHNNIDRILAAKKHLKRYNEIYGNNLSHMRKHCIWYVKGMNGANYARKNITECRKLEDYFEVLDALIDKQKKINT